MSLNQLPAEILRMIIYHLDVKSKLLLWDAFGEFLDVRCWPGLRRVRFARSCLTARALQHRLLSEHVRELDLSCVPNLQEGSALKLLPHLRSLDVSYTDLPLEDVFAVCAARSGLTHLTFDYGHCPRDEEIGSYLAMRNLEYVHLIGKFRPLFCCSRLVEILGRCTHLKQLKMTALSYEEDMHCLHNDYDPDEISLPVKMFSFRLRFCEPEFDFKTLSRIPLIQLLKCDLWEHAFFEFHLGKLSRLFLSPSFQRDPIPLRYLQSQMDDIFNRLVILDADYSYDIHIWHPDLSKLNPNFHKDIVREIGEKIPQSLSIISLNRPRLGSKDSFLMCQCTLREVEAEENVGNLYTRSTKQTKARLDLNISEFIDTKIPISVQYDLCERCKRSEKWKLCNVVLNINFNVLSHIVSLHLGALKVSSDALKSILMNCYKLKTLYVYLDVHNKRNFEDVLPLSKTIENIWITSRDDLYLEMILCGLSGCPSLKNVVISEFKELLPLTVRQQDYFNFIKNCPHLYSYYYTSFLSIDSNIISKHSEMITETLKTLEREDIIFGLLEKYCLLSHKGKLGYFESLNRKIFQETSYLDLKVNESLIM